VRILIKCSTGSTFPVWTEPSDTIAVLKERIVDLKAYPSDQQRLTFAGV
jgi:hypothetical protein